MEKETLSLSKKTVTRRNKLKHEEATLHLPIDVDRASGDFSNSTPSAEFNLHDKRLHVSAHHKSATPALPAGASALCPSDPQVATLYCATKSLPPMLQRSFHCEPKENLFPLLATFSNFRHEFMRKTKLHKMRREMSTAY